jgi:NAD(P)-dependent dehydrogenase (short-subunit alcohol dehydrogenase family)
MTRHTLITGASGGIGLEMAKALAAAGDALILTGRNPDKLQTAVDAVNASATDPKAEGVTLDIGDFDAVRRFAADINERLPHIDVLALNAGLYTRKLHTLPNGFEAMIGVMHLGHFLLANLLLDKLLAAPAARVVVTSSVGHKFGEIDYDSFTDPSKHRIGFSGYAQAKLANLLFARELARRYGDRGLTANAFHPGTIATGIWRELPQPIPWLADKFMRTPAQGADTGIWLAASDEAARINGEYCVDRKVVASSKAGNNLTLAADLWEKSEKLCGLA